MTEKALVKSRRNTAAALCLLVLFLILLLLKNPSVATECVVRSLSLCARAIIPSLFPFMVLSELLIAFGFGDLFGQRLGRPLARLFGISAASASAVFLGFLCGFPVGARMTLALYDKGQIPKGECERLLGFSNLPSIAFLVSAVGSSLYRNRSFGILLWLCCMAGTVTVGMLTRKKGASVKQAPRTSPPAPTPGAFTAAIASATAAMLTVCAYILFFGTVIGCLSHALKRLALGEAVNALLYGFFEISSGVGAAASLGNRPLSTALCALTVGWSGLSVHCQLMTLADGRSLSFRPYFLARVAQALLCALLVFVLSPFVF
ncbi:MAG: hypothetical protein J6D16_07645 [Clostridia bacterium]|nr:hypothetical protein [Clostridia bacterium]